jgi:hypothetical protein
VSKRKPTDTPTLPPVATFADARSQLTAFEEESAGVHLADWLIAGGEWYRSMQLTVAPPEKRADPSVVWTLM